MRRVFTRPAMKRALKPRFTTVHGTVPVQFMLSVRTGTVARVSRTYSAYGTVCSVRTCTVLVEPYVRTFLLLQYVYWYTDA